MIFVLLYQLMQVNDIEMRLEVKKPHDLMDHIQASVNAIGQHLSIDFLHQQLVVP